jgi:purine-binding chemotaxis protein CheW
MIHPETAEQTQYLTFHLAGEEYAVGILKVREIIEYGTLTIVPQTPPSIRGVINLRGNVVPVVDLALKFGMPQSPLTNRTCIVILEVAIDGEPNVIGVIADSVSQVIDLPPSEILPAPAFGTKIKVDFLHGMGKAGQKFVLILDIDKLLATEDVDAPAALSHAPSQAPITHDQLDRGGAAKAANTTHQGLGEPVE